MYLIPVLVDGELRYGVRDDDGMIVVGRSPGGRVARDASTFAPASRSNSSSATGGRGAAPRDAQPPSVAGTSGVSSSASARTRRPASGSPRAPVGRGASQALHASAEQASPRAQVPHSPQRQVSATTR